MNNGLLYLGCFFALLLAALFGVPYAVDWNGYRGVFEEEATKVLGRDVRVGGAVSVRLLPTPYVRFEKVRLADTTGQTGEPFIRADSFTMRLAVSPLLRGAFEATDIELAKPVLSLVPDKEGGGNWTSLELRPAELPFIPQNVTLHSVRLIDGTLAIHRPDGGGITRVESINGELSAETLKGPFRFKGSGIAGGKERDIKFATFAPDANGVVRFKAAMHGGERDNSYLFDGQVEDFASKPRVSGDLTGKVVLAAPLAADGAPTKEASPVFDLKSTVKADARGAAFDAVELALDNSGEPQIITGKATAQWNGESRIDAALAAKWLDLDLLAASKGQPATIAGLKGLFVSLMEGLGSGGTTAVRLDVEQAKIGGEAAGLLVLDAERHQDDVVLRQLRSGLPGGAHFELAGGIKSAGQGKAPSFTGQGVVRGVNFEKAQSFLRASGIDIDLKAQGPFWAAGRVAISDQSFAVTEAKAEIGGQAVAGDVVMDRGERSRIAVRLEGEHIDSAVFFPQAAAQVESVVLQALGTGASKASKASKDDAGTSFKIAAGELLHGGRTFKNVEASVAVDGATLNISSVRFALPAGGVFSAGGLIDTSGAKGGLNYEFEATSKDALKEAASLFGLSNVIGDDGLHTLPGLQIAGLVKIGQRGSGTSDVTFDGTAGATKIAGDAGFEGGFAAWNTAPVRANISARGPDVAQILNLLGGDAEALKGLKTRPGEATFALSGPVSEGAKTYADISADGLNVALSGTLLLNAEKAFAHTASGMLKARDAREALALAGVAASGGLAQSTLDGPFEIASQGTKLVLSSPGLKVAASRIQGKVELSKSAAGSAPMHIAGSVEADRVSVAGLLSWLTEADQRAANDDAAATPWPEANFNIEPLTRLEGTVNLKAASLELSDDMQAHKATADIVLGSGKVKVANLQAGAAGGSLSGEVSAEKGLGGVALSANLQLDADLSSLSPRASGRAILDLTGSGRALNPAAAISAFTGKGTIKLADARHPGPSAALVADASDAVMSGKIVNDAGALAPALISGLNVALVVPGSRTIPFNIAAGDMKVDAYTIEGAQGSARVTTTVSLSKLLVDSAWQVTAVASPLPPPPEAGPDWKPAAKGPLPPVAFVYTGPLGDPSRLQVNAAPEDLSRELGVRIMERKVEELEVLRKRDEDRQRMEIERRKALELERQQAAAAAAAARAQAAHPQPPPQPAQAPAPEAEKMPPVIQEPDANNIVPQAGLPGDPVDGAPAGTASVDAIDGQPKAGVAGATPVPRPAVPRPQPRPQRSRSTSEEANRAFGGWP